MDLLLLLAWLAVCADQDARQRQVSNWLTLGAGALALAYLVLRGQTWLGASAAEGGWALLFAALLTLPGYALGKLGAADVKLLAALALATDRLYLLGTLIGAGVVIVLWLLIRQKTGHLTIQWLANRYIQMDSKSQNKQPFVPFLFAGFALTRLCLH